MRDNENVVKAILSLKAENPKAYEVLTKACATLEKERYSNRSYRGFEVQLRDVRELEDAKEKEYKKRFTVMAPELGMGNGVKDV